MSREIEIFQIKLTQKGTKEPFYFAGLSVSPRGFIIESAEESECMRVDRIAGERIIAGIRAMFKKTYKCKLVKVATL